MTDDIIPWLRGWKNASEGESDRAMAVLAGAFLETRLRALVMATLVESLPEKQKEALFKRLGPLSTFENCIEVACAFGVIPRDLAHDLHLVRRIRNDFAHDMDATLSFSSTTIAARAMQLAHLRSVMKWSAVAIRPLPESEVERLTDSPRRRFEVGVAILLHELSSHIGSSTHRSPMRGLVEAETSIIAQIASLEASLAGMEDCAEREQLREKVKRLRSRLPPDA